MNETYHPASASGMPWSTDDLQSPLPGTLLTSGNNKSASAAAGLLRNVAQGAHDTVDRLADSAEPAAQKLGESAESARAALHVKTDQLRQRREEWVEGMRGTVRSNPLASLAAALALGAVIARITRQRRP